LGNNVSGMDDDGIRLTSTAATGVFDVSLNVLDDNGGDGIDLLMAGANNDGSINGNTVGSTTGNGGDGIRLTVNGGTADWTLNSNNVFDSGDNGISIVTSGAGNNFDLSQNTLGNTGQGNAGDGLFFNATAGSGSVEVRGSIVGQNVFNENAEQGFHLLIANGATYNARVDDNSFTDSGSFGFLAQSDGNSGLNLVFLGNNAAGNNGADADYRFEENSVGAGIKFENPDFDELFPFPLYQANSQTSGTFNFTGSGLDDDDDVAVGTFVFP
jgi:hypothetical protein